MTIQQFVETNIQKIDELEKKLVEYKETVKKLESALNLTFFSKNWSKMLGLKWYFFTFILFYFRDYFNQFWYDFSFIFICCMVGFLFVNVFSSTIVYIGWVYYNRKIKILQTEIDLRFAFIKNFLNEAEKSLKNHEQS